MNCGSKSSSPSDADGDRSAQDDARTSPASASPTDAAADRVATGESCAWCGRGPSNDEADFHVDETWPSAADDDDDRRRRSAYDQLRFCSRSCLSRYKMDLFCRETQRYLHQLQVASQHAPVFSILANNTHYSRRRHSAVAWIGRCDRRRLFVCTSVGLCVCFSTRYLKKRCS